MGPSLLPFPWANVCIASYLWAIGLLIFTSHATMLPFFLSEYPSLSAVPLAFLWFIGGLFSLVLIRIQKSFQLRIIFSVSLLVAALGCFMTSLTAFFDHVAFVLVGGGLHGFYWATTTLYPFAGSDSVPSQQKALATGVVVLGGVAGGVGGPILSGSTRCLFGQLSTAPTPGDLFGPSAVAYENLMDNTTATLDVALNASVLTATPYPNGDDCKWSFAASYLILGGISLVSAVIALLYRQPPLPGEDPSAVFDHFCVNEELQVAEEQPEARSSVGLTLESLGVQVASASQPSSRTPSPPPSSSRGSTPPPPALVKPYDSPFNSPSSAEIIAATDKARRAMRHPGGDSFASSSTDAPAPVVPIPKTTVTKPLSAFQFFAAAYAAAFGFATMALVMMTSGRYFEQRSISIDRWVPALQIHFCVMFLPSILTGSLTTTFGVRPPILMTLGALIGLLGVLAAFVVSDTSVAKSFDGELDWVRLAIPLAFSGLAWNLQFVSASAYVSAQSLGRRSVFMFLVYCINSSAFALAGYVSSVIEWQKLQYFAIGPSYAAAAILALLSALTSRPA